MYIYYIYIYIFILYNIYISFSELLLKRLYVSKVSKYFLGVRISVRPTCCVRHNMTKKLGERQSLLGTLVKFY